MIVPDLAPPVTQVTHVDTTTSTFLVSMEGFDVGSNGVVASFDLFVSIDGGAAKRFTTVAGGSPDGGGVYHVQTQYAAKTDGLAHTYRFYSRGTDGRNIEAAPVAPADVVVSGTFASPLLAPLTSGPMSEGLDAFFSDPGNVAGLLTTA